MRERIILIVLAVLGWAVCGATVGVGRQLTSMQTTLIVHALVAPVAFGLLAWFYARRFPHVSAAQTALMNLGIVAGLDALLVAPFFEHSYAMFRSILGVWIPFASILGASYAGSRFGRTQKGE